MKPAGFHYKTLLILISFGWLGCRSTDSASLEAFEQQLNTDTEKEIDAAYAAIQHRCDSLMQFYVPEQVDSIIQAETSKP